MDPDQFIFHKEKDRLADFSTTANNHSKDSDDVREELERGIRRLAELQDRLYAQDQQSLLIIFQAMDAAGKDSTIKHVMSGINPQGCSVTSFKAPSSEELDHNYLWRCMKVTPAKGDIGIFNRSYYEEVLVVRVHPELLTYQKLPGLRAGQQPDDAFWQTRFDDINNFESQLIHNGTHILKFFLNVSKEEQKERFLKRIDAHEKNWKFSIKDVQERQYWDDYQWAYEQMMLHTSTEVAPWYVIPADKKWYMQQAVCNIIVNKLESLDLHFPPLSAKQIEELQKGKEMLINE